MPPSSTEFDPTERLFVMNYNILAQSLLEDNARMYRKACSLGFGHWPYRIVNILAELLRSQSHLLCLQEVDATAHDELIAALQPHGYRGIYHQRGGGKKDGCAIYYHSTVRLVEHRELSLEFESRSNVAVVGVFDHPSCRVIVACTHLHSPC